MNKLLFIVTCCATLFLFSGCSSNNSTTASNSYADYPYSATIDGIDNIIILGKTEDDISAFVGDYSTDSALSNDLSSSTGNHNHNSDDIIIESATPNGFDVSGWGSCDIVFRNCSGESLKLISLTVDYLDKNNTILESTYPQYTGMLNDGQACTLNVLYQEQPYALRVSSVNAHDMEDNFIQIYFESPYVFSSLGLINKNAFFILPCGRCLLIFKGFCSARQKILAILPQDLYNSSGIFSDERMLLIFTDLLEDILLWQA